MRSVDQAPGRCSLTASKLSHVTALAAHILRLAGEEDRGQKGFIPTVQN